MSNANASCFCVGKVAGCTCGGRCRCACTCAKDKIDDNVYEFNFDWLDQADPNEGQEIHRTKGGKGKVGQAIAKSKQPPNCS